MEKMLNDMIYDVVIAGSGPAGLAAAVYAQRAELNALVIEKNYMSGGQIINTYEVDNYPGFPGINGFDLAVKFHEHAVKLGARFVTDEIDSVKKEGDIWVMTGKNGVYKTRTVLAACGAHHRKLGIPGEEEFSGKGVSYCATCDGAFYRKKDVAVNGGGNTALEDAAFLANICRKVYIIHRRDQFRADEAEVAGIRGRDNVELVLNSTISALQSEEGKLSAVVTKDKVTGAERTIPVSGLFVAIGQVPSNAAFKDVAEQDPAGYIIAGEDCRTSTPGIFAAGDCRTKKVRQLTTAAADGAVAALAACSYVDEA
ncbi:MAG: thioredoxin-disulfide reductase [Lachnospiraceae bacterium]|nr:thioredoxin-disulfide reductase [Lachnospiraceae bacterium]